MAKQYADRDAEQLDRDGNYYCRHVSAMTAEGLHAKSDIAAELAWRDREIDRLTAALSNAAQGVGEPRKVSDEERQQHERYLNSQEGLAYRQTVALEKLASTPAVARNEGEVPDGFVLIGPSGAKFGKGRFPDGSLRIVGELMSLLASSGPGGGVE